jgi:hypothetical protein
VKRIAIALVLLLAAPAHAQDAAAPPPTAPAPAPEAALFDYQATLARLKAGDLAVDYRALRLASVRQPDFSGYGRFDIGKAYDLADAQEFATIREMAERHLKDEYLDPNAHFWLGVACRELGESRCAERHTEIRKGLLRSIMASGDGGSAETAFEVIGVDEEYAVLRAAGMQSEGQSLQSDDKGGMFDVLHAVDRDGKKHYVWFRINAFFGKY